MALDAMDGQGAGQRAASADAHQVAKSFLRRRFAGQAKVDALPGFAKMFRDPAHAVDGVALLVRGQQQGDGAGVAWMRVRELFQCDYEGRHAAFHVGCAAAVEIAIAKRRLEWRTGPCHGRAARHHVGMAEENQHGLAAAVRRPEIVDDTKAQLLDGEAARGQAIGDQ